uniref:Uncharacterized protein n=2 Tax=Oryza TaxID=4527 RepID=A0A0D3HLN6_9ORYZ
MAPTVIAVTPWMAGGEVMVEMEEKQRACAAEMQRVLEGSNVEGEESRDAAGDGEGVSVARGAEEFEAKMRAPREEAEFHTFSDFVIVLVIYRQESSQIKEKPTQSPGCRLTIWTGMLLLSAVIRGGRCIIAGDCDADRARSEIDVHDPDAEIWVTRDVQRSSGVVDR